MTQAKPAANLSRVHLVTGGFPAGSNAGHDMDFARLRLLSAIQSWGASPAAGATLDAPIRTTVGNDFADIDRWLPETKLLVTYVAGPFPTDAQCEQIDRWLNAGGRWLAFHGSAGGKAVRVERGGKTRKQMVKTRHHDTLGGFFLNHPPLRKFEVHATASSHPLLAGVPSSFEVSDELYLIEVLDPQAELLLTTDLPEDPSPDGFGFVYDRDTSLQADGRTRVLGYTRAVGDGGVTYIGLGHCHSAHSNTQSRVDDSVGAGGITPPTFAGSWDTDAFKTLITNGIQWGLTRSKTV